MKTAELQQKTLVLAKAFSRTPENEEIDEKFELILIPSKEAIYEKAEKMIRNTQEICFLGLRKRMSSWLSHYSPHLEKALARKVDCRIIMPKTENIKTDEH